MLYSEFLNFFVWFIKFLPLFIILFPIHKAMWFQEKDFDGPIPAGAGAGGNLFDYLLCRKSCRYPGGYVKDDRPRCVQPETHNVSRPSIRSIVDVFHAEGFSTMRRFDSTFGTTDPHEAFKPPADSNAADAPAASPAEPETEREGAGDAADDALAAAPDEASSGP